MTVDAHAAAATPAEEEAKGVTRREFLNYAWLASLGILTVQIAGISYLFTMPRFKEGEFGGTFTLGPATQLPTVGAAPVANDEGKFWLVQSEQGIVALYKVCTHLGCLYNWEDAENKFLCPCHGSMFQRDGTYIQGPAPRSLDRFVVILRDATTGVELAQTDSEGNPTPITNPNAIVQVDTGKRLLGKRRA